VTRLLRRREFLTSQASNSTGACGPQATQPSARLSAPLCRISSVTPADLMLSNPPHYLRLKEKYVPFRAVLAASCVPFFHGEPLAHHEET
jgi:hypothetical protein